MAGTQADDAERDVTSIEPQAKPEVTSESKPGSTRSAVEYAKKMRRRKAHRARIRRSHANG